MACTPCWQQRQALMAAMRQGNPWGMARAVTQGVNIATDKYIRGIDVSRKYPPVRYIPVRRRPSA